MIQANFSITYWGDALLTATYVLNYIPSKLIITTPYELWIKCKHNFSILKFWGCAAYAHDSSYKNKRLSLWGKKYIFIRNFK
jgi:hypothetical protein